MKTRMRYHTTRRRYASERAGALVELTLFLPVTLLILLGILTSTELIQSASEASQLSREVGNLALRSCPALQGTTLSTCLSDAARSILSLRPPTARRAQALVSIYRCPSFSCVHESSGLSCPVLSTSCHCRCAEASLELAGQGQSDSESTFRSDILTRLTQSPHLLSLFNLKGFLVVSEVRAQSRDGVGPLNSLGAYEVSFL